MTSSFDRLSPALQYQITYNLGFRELRPVQELTIPAVLDGAHCLVLAPTAGGKTESAFFPLLSAMDTEDWRPVSVIYLSPLRALLNNQEDRVSRYAGMLSRRAFKWHGDTPPTQRKAFIREPSDILLTTPESLEAMMMSSKVPTGTLFSSLRAVIIDEVHAFAGDDRGAHLLAVLERLKRICRYDFQRIGLSATVGNPETILTWMAGNSQRPRQVVRPPLPPSRPQISLDFVGTVENAALVIRQLHPGRKRLVFVDSRRGVEELGKLLLRDGVDAFVLHGSLSVSERRDAEQAFQDRNDCVIVSTSALELGIDIGDLDHVLQLDCPTTVASFLQRLGRTGRRPNTVANCTFLVAREKMMLQAASLLALHEKGYVEPVKPSSKAFHILAHQILALCIQHGGVPKGDWYAWLQGSSAFEKITPQERAQLIEHMLQEQILADQDGRLWLGPQGERLYGKRNFGELYSVFSTPKLLSVQHGTYEVGTVDAEFLEALDSNAEQGAFVLAGRPWLIVSIDWNRAVCAVRPAEQAKAPRWSGSPQFLSYEICQAMRQLMLESSNRPYWSQRTREILSTIRMQYEFVHEGQTPWVESKDGITWWTFAGGKANLLLARLIESELGGKCVVRNTSITCKDEAAKSLAALREYIFGLAKTGRPNHQDARRLSTLCAARLKLSKFGPCLPESLLQDYLVDMGLDEEGSRKAVLAAVQVDQT